MKKLMALVVCGILVGCEYNVPLVKTPELGIDSAVVGLWQRSKEDGQKERLLVLPLNKQEYMVSFPAGSKDAMFARACLCQAADMTLVQLEWIGTAPGRLPENNRVFQFATYSVVGDTITVRMLNADVVNKDVKSTAELAKAIADNKDKPDVLKDKMVFTKVKN
ncbi:MAG: hypothetical protein KJ964_01690 [Verrucomicrobia bacterium]|nr:hypothetical protein [Verrucomicrobiota bacterium]MBU1734099.1 hypothetical protein [Verrucomicrobiota bacterium]MBU1856413.1 hypothetical protein [Verrucomicrobiota bacterium]